MKNLELHQIINGELDLEGRLFTRPLDASKIELQIAFRRDRMKRMIRNSKFWEQLQRQKRMLENGQNMSDTHIKMLKKFKETDNKKLSFVDRMVLKKVIEVMTKRLDNEEMLLLGRLESFRNLRKGLGL